MYFQTFWVMFFNPDSCKERLYEFKKTQYESCSFLMREFNPIIFIVIMDIFTCIFLYYVSMLFLYHLTLD